MGTHNRIAHIPLRTPHRTVLLVLALACAIVHPLHSAEADVAAGVRVLIGPFPDVPAFAYPIGSEASVRFAWYGAGPNADGGFYRGPGWAVRFSGAYLIGNPVQEVFEDVRIGLFMLETGPTYLVGQALGLGLSVDLTGGGGYYAAAYTFNDQSVRAYRPSAGANMTITTAMERFGVRVTGGYLVFFEEVSRGFASVSLAVLMPLRG